MAQLPHGAILVVASVPDSDKGRVPGPLVGVEPRAGLSVMPGPVELQHHLRVFDKSGIISHHKIEYFCTARNLLRLQEDRIPRFTSCRKGVSSRKLGFRRTDSRKHSIAPVLIS